MVSTNRWRNDAERGRALADTRTQLDQEAILCSTRWYRQSVREAVRAQVNSARARPLTVQIVLEVTPLVQDVTEAPIFESLPDPGGTVMASVAGESPRELDADVTGAPHAIASNTGRPKPRRPRDSEMAELYQMANCSAERPMNCIAPGPFAATA